MIARVARNLAAIIVAASFPVVLECVYVVFYSGYGRTGGYGWQGVPIRPEYAKKFIADTAVNELPLSIILFSVLVLPICLLLRRCGRLSVRNVSAALFTIAMCGCIFVTFVATSKGEIPVALILLMIIGLMAAAVMGVIFGLLSGLRW